MCLAIPAEVVELEWPFATVNMKGARKRVRVDLIENINVGDYVLVHVGIAIQKVSKKEVEEIESLWRQILEE